MPARIQRRRSKGWRAPLDAQGRKPVYVGRGTRWGNPWVVTATGHGTGWAVNWAGHRDQIPHGLATEIPADSQRDAHACAAELYQTWLISQTGLLDRARRELDGRDLMCWCAEPLPCHVDPLIELVNAPATGT